MLYILLPIVKALAILVQAATVKHWIIYIVDFAMLRDKLYKVKISVRIQQYYTSCLFPSRRGENVTFSFFPYDNGKQKIASLRQRFRVSHYKTVVCYVQICYRCKLQRCVCNRFDVLQDSQRDSSLVYSSQQMSVQQRHSGRL